MRRRLCISAFSVFALLCACTAEKPTPNTNYVAPEAVSSYQAEMTTWEEKLSAEGITITFLREGDTTDIREVTFMVTDDPERLEARKTVLQGFSAFLLQSVRRFQGQQVRLPQERTYVPMISEKTSASFITAAETIEELIEFLEGDQTHADQFSPPGEAGEETPAEGAEGTQAPAPAT